MTSKAFSTGLWLFCCYSALVKVKGYFYPWWHFKHLCHTGHKKSILLNIYTICLLCMYLFHEQLMFQPFMIDTNFNCCPLNTKRSFSSVRRIWNQTRPVTKRHPWPKNPFETQNTFCTSCESAQRGKMKRVGGKTFKIWEQKTNWLSLPLDLGLWRPFVERREVKKEK